MARVSTKDIVLLVGATFGASLALLVPMVFTLALRVDQIAPGDRPALGYVIGAGALVMLLAAPLTGVLSDRFRSRWGRRRPFTIAGVLVGVLAIPLLAYSSDLIVLGAGWMVASLGWGTVLGSIGNYQADRLPPEQRGSVSGITGLTSQIAPVVGIVLVGLVGSDPLLVVLLPVLVGLPLVVLFLLFAQEDDSRDMPETSRLSIGGLVRSFGFRPREHPDFAWSWLGRFLFFAGISSTTTFATFFYASRLGIAVQDIAPVVATVSVLGVATASIGALVGGALSDRLGRRRPFILIAVLVFAVGSCVLAFATSLPAIIAGSMVSALGVAMFLAVSQALTLDVLPHRATQAGRFMGITSFSQKIPNAVAPLIAPFILTFGSANGSNFTALYLTTAALVLIGGIITVLGVRSVR